MYIKKIGRLNELIISGTPYSQGLVHLIYRYGNYIYKIAKTDFPDFNNREHFLIEKKTLELLATLGVPVPIEKKVGAENIDNKNISYLCESFVEGVQYKWDSLPNKALTNLFDIYTKAHKVAVKNFGPLDSGLGGNFLNWYEYIVNIINNSDFLKLENKKIMDRVVVKFSDYLYKIKTPSLVLVDLNPGNIFFNKDSDIMGVIDIDHPIGGDPLYDFASVKWYNPKTYKKFKDNITKFDLGDEKIINFYCLVQGLNVIDWMNKHKLPILKEQKQFLVQLDLMGDIL